MTRRCLIFGETR